MSKKIYFSEAERKAGAKRKAREWRAANRAVLIAKRREKRAAINSAARARYGSPKPNTRLHPDEPREGRAPAHVLAERDRRLDLLAAQSDTDRLLGVPPPGYGGGYADAAEAVQRGKP